MLTITTARTGLTTTRQRVHVRVESPRRPGRRSSISELRRRQVLTRPSWDTVRILRHDLDEVRLT